MHTRLYHTLKNPLLLILFCYLLSCKKEHTVIATPNFDYQVIDNNYTIPVKLSFKNNSSGADKYLWTFDGGNPATSSKKDPGVIQFDKAGSYKVTLEAWNLDSRNKKEITIVLDSAVTIGFDTLIVSNHFSPMQVQIKNKTKGGTSFKWLFDGGSPSASILEQPPVITFTDTGYHNINLVVSNGRQNFSLTKKVYVASSINADFTIVPSFQNEDYEASLTATLQNKTVSGLNWKWTSTGGVISNPNIKNPAIYFKDPGTYYITLATDNNKQSKKVTKSITVLPNRNLRTFTDIQLGINTAHATIGSFFSTILRKKFTASDNLDTAGKYIDIVFFGLNQHFLYNKFLSPDSAGNYTFASIPQAGHTKFINSRENCNCGVNFTSADFDNMTNDTPLQSQSINPSTAGAAQFNNSVLPRLILFQTQDGRKGAIKLKQYVTSGSQSYITIDIKIQKTP